MHPEPDHKPYVHPNIPIVSLDSQQVGGLGWRIPSIGETVKTYWMAFVFQPRPMWKISTYWTHEEYKHTGLTNYRVPASFGAWLTVLPPLVKKVVRGLLSGEIWAGKGN